MLLAFRDAIRLTTKKVTYEEGCQDPNPDTLKLLKELSSKRRVIEESLNRRSTIKESVAGEMAEVNYQDQQRLEQYIPLLMHLLAYTDSHPKPSPILCWMCGLKLKWSSSMTSSCRLKIGGPKFYHIYSFQFELGMSLFLYGAVLRERGFATLSTGELVESVTLFRKAAGVFSYLAEKVLPPLKYMLPDESPVEATSSLSSLMRIICLADAQAVIIKRAEEKENSPLLLSKLHYGISQILDEATCIMNAKPGELKDLSASVKEFVFTCKVLHELRSQMSLAEELRSNEKIGMAILVLRHGTANLKKVKTPKNEPYTSIFHEEVKDASEMLRKFEHENDFVWQQKIPTAHLLPSLQGKSIVTSIPYEPQKLEGPELSMFE